MKYIDKYIITFFILSYVTKMIIFSASIADALVTLCLTSLHGYKLYLDSKVKPDVTVELKQEVQQLKNSFDRVKLNVGIKDDRNTFKF
jgi:hypothetical protein